MLSSTHEYFSVSEPDSCEKSLSFLLPPNSFLRMVMVLQRSYLICLLLRGNNGIQLSVSEGFRSFGFLFFSYFSLVKLGTKRHCCCSSKGSNTIVTCPNCFCEKRFVSLTCPSSTKKTQTNKSKKKQNKRTKLCWGQFFYGISKFQSYVSAPNWV